MGRKAALFFSGHLNLRTCRYVLVRLARQATLKSSTFWYVRAGKGLNTTRRGTTQNITRNKVHIPFSIFSTLCDVCSTVLNGNVTHSSVITMRVNYLNWLQFALTQHIPYNT
jgi:hypothetical protein